MKSVGQKRQRGKQIGSKAWQGGPPAAGYTASAKDTVAPAFKHLGHFATGKAKTLKGATTHLPPIANR